MVYYSTSPGEKASIGEPRNRGGDSSGSQMDLGIDGPSWAVIARGGCSK